MAYKNIKIRKQMVKESTDDATDFSNWWLRNHIRLTKMDFQTAIRKTYADGFTDGYGAGEDAHAATSYKSDSW